MFDPGKHREAAYSSIVSNMCTPAQALERLRAARSAELNWLRVGDSEHYARAKANIDLIDSWIASAELGIARRAQLDRDREAAAAAQQAEREAAAEATLRAELHSAFAAANPNASEADFAAAYGELKARHQIRRMDEAQAVARASMAKYF